MLMEGRRYVKICLNLGWWKKSVAAHKYLITQTKDWRAKEALAVGDGCN